jgi:uncharacterized protein
MRDLAHLEAHLAALPSAVLGYSGGVDSALLAVAATRALGPARFLAVIGRSASYPEVQYQAALALAREYRIPLLELATGELEDPNYRANTPDRCYFCKRELWTRLGELATERGFAVVLDGTNADDRLEHRPGLRASAEFEVRSPLMQLGWTKEMVRAAARTLGLPIWDAPASPCLSSRIQYGLEVTPARLAQVERAEALLRDLGVRGDLRVRHRGDAASVEVTAEMRPRLEAVWAAVEQGLRALGFDEVRLDPKGYRRGALVAELPVLGG